MAILTTIALVLGYVEKLIPVTSAMPGVKLGLANTVLLYAIYMMHTRQAFTLMILKVLLSGIMFSGFSGALFSFAGGVLSLIVMLLFKRIPGIGVIGVSVAGAVFHNIGQVLVAMMVAQTRGLLLYMPVLMIAGVLTGSVTGIIAKCVLKYMHYNHSSDSAGTRKYDTVVR